MVDLAMTLLNALWIMLPAYIPNPVAALLGGGLPVDMGRRCRDGRRVLGDGKTFRGLAAGIVAGILTGMLQLHLQNMVALGSLASHSLLSVILMATGALLGDLVKSFFKRRLGKEKGEAWPIADQYDLVAGAFLLNLVLNAGWLLSRMNLGTFIAILLLTPVLHRAVNIIGYLTGVKDVPW